MRILTTPILSVPCQEADFFSPIAATKMCETRTKVCSRIASCLPLGENATFPPSSEPPTWIRRNSLPVAVSHNWRIELKSWLPPGSCLQLARTLPSAESLTRTLRSWSTSSAATTFFDSRFQTLVGTFSPKAAMPATTSHLPSADMSANGNPWGGTASKAARSLPVWMSWISGLLHNCHQPAVVG